MVDYRYWWLMIDELDDVVRYSNKTTTETDTKDLQNWKRHILLYCMLFIYTPCFTYCIFISSFYYYILIIDFILYTILFTLYIYIHCFHNKKVICLGGESCSSKFLDLSCCEHREHRTKTDHATHVFTAKKGVHFRMYKKNCSERNIPVNWIIQVFVKQVLCESNCSRTFFFDAQSIFFVWIQISKTGGDYTPDDGNIYLDVRCFLVHVAIFCLSCR